MPAKRHDGLFPLIASFQALRAAALRAIRGKRAKPGPRLVLRRRLCAPLLTQRPSPLVRTGGCTRRRRRCRDIEQGAHFPFAGSEDVQRDVRLVAYHGTMNTGDVAEADFTASTGIDRDARQPPS